MIVIGLGSGRSGSRSLAHLINAQQEAVCFHEMNPSSMKWEHAEGTVYTIIERFQAILAGGERFLPVDYSVPHRGTPLNRLNELPTISLIGDVASYYLEYVPFVLERWDVRFPVLKRDRESTIRSFVEKKAIKRYWRQSLADRLQSMVSGKPFHTHSNNFVEHDGSRWRPRPVWDKCFPKFDANSLEEAIGKYWDYYYDKAAAFEDAYPRKVSIFDIGQLNESAGQERILEFCGCSEMTYVSAHENKGSM